MKHVIIGTAGHVDHGKTTLIRALTHIETDRLKEEQARGISIDIGFAYFDLPSGRRAGIIDVPGHERFIKNMLAGIGGIDLAMLVIAADEGVMPQTKEHLHILDLLQIKQGLIALTKIDMVDEDWLDLVIEEIKEGMKDTFLEDAVIIPVSGITGQGIEELTTTIDSLTAESISRDTRQKARLPIDRVFTVAGFGTVVTGTLVSGSIHVGERLTVYPQGLEVRVRGLQVHGQKTELAEAGQRTAVNLAGVEMSQLNRGDVLAATSSIAGTLMIDARLRLLKDAEHSLQHRTRVRLYSGAAEVMARVTPLEQEEILPGESGLVQLRLEEPLAATTDDIFVLRSYSPMMTIAGGRVIDAAPRKKTRFRTEQVAELRIREQGDPLEKAEQIMYSESSKLVERVELIKLLDHLKEADELIEELLAQDKAIVLHADQKEYVFSERWLEELAQQMEQLFQRFHKANPLRSGMPREELRNRILKQASSRLFSSLLLLWESEGLITQIGQNVALQNFSIILNQEQEAILHKVMDQFAETPFNPPMLSDLSLQFKQIAEWPQLWEYLIAENKIKRLSDEVYFSLEAMEEAEKKLYDHFSNNQEISLAEFRDLLQTSRKYALVLLEFFDAQRITQRRGDNRILRKRV